MSATPEQAWTALINTLSAALEEGETLAYVNGVYQGYREGVIDYPVIVVEPDEEPEVPGSVNGFTDVSMKVRIGAFLEIHDPDLQIVGDDTVKGIMDLKNDICKVLSADQTLGNVVIDTMVKNVLYDFSDYPYRGVTMDIELEYRQNTQSRS
jgi:hypothetical protein